MTKLADIRKHVLDDAAELAHTTGVVDPLIQADLDTEEECVPRFLRAQLARHVILVVMRMYDRPRKGPSGETASIPVLLSFASSEGLLTTYQAKSFSDRLPALKDEMEKRGVSFGTLKAFRNAELAHSLHSGPLGVIGNWPVWEFAHGTYELVLEIDAALVRAGCPLIENLDREFDIWRDQGVAFWEAVKIA